MRDGLFEFNPNRHDYGDKVFLGQRDQGPRPGRGRRGARPARARSPPPRASSRRKLAAYFVADEPPPALVERMAAASSRAATATSPPCCDALFDAPEFDASLGDEFKDPVHYVVSAVRLAYDERVDPQRRPMLGWLNRLGEGLFYRQTPDGYPLDAAAWAGRAR